MNDFDYLIKRLSVAFGIDYYKQDEKVLLLFELAQIKGYSKEEFKKTLNEFLMNQSHPTWTPADFFKLSRLKIYTVEKVKDLTNGTLQGFKVCTLNGSKVWIDEHTEISPPLERIEERAVKILEMDEIKKHYAKTNTE